jgi:soluble lytic murein transglycosylase-like protein
MRVVMNRRHLCGFGVFLLLVIPGYVASSRSGASELASPINVPAMLVEEVMQCTETILDEMVERLGAALGAVAESAQPRIGIDYHIRDVANRYGVSEELIVAIIEAESQFDTHAVSDRGALGLMQLMPATAATLGVQDPFDARENIEGGVRHLLAMMARFRGNLRLALAAYNAGEQAVIKHRGVPPYPETREYVRRILERSVEVGKDIRAGSTKPLRRSTYVPVPNPVRLPRPYTSPLA